MGLGFGCSWLPEFERAPRSWDPVASWLMGPDRLPGAVAL
jgi:hypothetical protein